ncbi:MAG: hypothetical protein RLZZ612_1491 [Pseudomonadota bacterium]
MAKITVYCQPGAKQTQVAGWHDGKLKIQLKAPPVDGAANKALLAFMAELCQVAKSHITLEQGSTSRTKRLHIDGMDEAQLQAALAPFSDTIPPPAPATPLPSLLTSVPQAHKKHSKK